MDHDRHGRVRVLVGVRAAPRGLGGPRRALDDRRDELEVARVGLQVDADRAAVGQLVGALRAVVVLDVARAALRDRRHDLERRGALELGEDRVVGAAEVVGEHVQPAAVGHPDDDLLAAVRGRQLDQLVEHRHGHVEALDRELVLAEVGLVHEALERVDLDQPLEQRAALVVGQLVAEGAGLDVLAQPHALAVRGDVLDLVGDRAAVGLAQVRERVGQRRARARTSGRGARGSAPAAPGVRPSASGSSPGSPSGSEPSGSRRAARWPWLRTRPTKVRRRLHGLQHFLARRRRRGRRGGRGARPARAGRGRGPSSTPRSSKTLLVEAVLALQVLLDRARGSAPTRRPG